MNSKLTSVDHEATEIIAPATRRRNGGASLYGASVEYGLHCILWLVRERTHRVSSRELAELQGVPPAMLAKILPRLERAGILSSAGGIAGGYTLGRPAAEISVLDVVEAIEEGRQLFDCKEVRRGCILFGGEPPIWSAGGTCGIHAVMLRAERRMRQELARTSLADLSDGVKRPPEFENRVAAWFKERSDGREAARIAALKGRGRPPS